MTRHVLDLEDLGPSGIAEVVALAREAPSRVLAGLGVAMVFEKPSARTRNSTEMAVVDLGGHPVMITDAEVGIDRRESAEDVARTLGCFHRVVAARVNDHEVLARMRVALERDGFETSVVNLLSDVSHPCQAIADLLTIADEKSASGDLSELRGMTITYIGDANNVTRSLAQAALSIGMNVRVAAPKDFQLGDAALVDYDAFAAHGEARLDRYDDPLEAADGADVLYTDVWTSMGQEAEMAARREAFRGYTIDDRVLEAARPDAIVLHCLPAHRGEEITESVLEGPASKVWVQAAHRRTAMLGVFRWVMGEGGA